MWTLPDGAACEARLTVRRSHFLARLSPARDAADVRDAIRAARAAHPDARHHCSAHVLSAPGRQAARGSSDDGEPGGTAGAPILRQMERVGACDAVLVVTRYFGGVLLGAPGLRRAYGTAARMALDQATRLPLVPAARLLARLPLGDAARVEAGLRRVGVRVVGTRFAADALLEAVAPPGEVATAQAQLARLTAGGAHFDVGATVLRPLDNPADLA